jgi:hypothetical protein
MPEFWGDMFSPQHTKPALAWEFTAYLGVLPLLLAWFAIRSGRPLAKLWLGIALVGLIGAGGDRLVLYRLLSLLPGWDLMRAPARLLSWYGIGVAVLAGLGAEEVLTGRARVTRLGAQYCVVALMAIAGCAVVGPPFVEAHVPGAGEAAGEALLWLAVFGGLVVAWCTVGVRPVYRGHQGPVWVAVALVLADVLVTGEHLAPVTTPPPYLSPPMADTLPIAAPPGREAELFWWRPDTNLMVGQANLFNMSPLSLSRHAELFKLAQQDPTGEAERRLLRLLGARRRATVTAGTVAWQDIDGPFPAAWPVERLEPLPDEGAAAQRLLSPGFAPDLAAVVVGGDPAAVGQPVAATVVSSESPTPNRTRYDVMAMGDAYWVLNESAYPGRRAYVDGKAAELARVDLLLSGVAATGEGRHSLVVLLQSTTVKAGRFVGLLALLGLTTAAVAGRRHG